MRPGYGGSKPMELRHLRYFNAVAQERGFGRAAAVLHLAQPALSRQIKDLEDEVGVSLFERTPRGVDITPAGEAFQGGVSRVLSAVEDALTACRRAAAGHEGRCTVAAGRMLMSIASPENPMLAVVRARKELPDAEIAIEELNLFDQVPRMVSGDIDIGIAFPPEDERIEGEPWAIQPFDCALVSSGHRLAGRAMIEPEDLSDEPAGFITPSLAAGPSELYQRAMAKAGITSPQEFIYASPQSGIMMVASGRGWAPVPQGLAQNPPQGTVVIPVRGFQFPLRLDLIWRRGEARPVVLAVLEVLRAFRDERPAKLPTHTTEVTTRPGVPHGLELRHLRSFTAVADDGGFGRAAERLEVTQSSLSRQIADLEHLVGAPLFDRSARGTTLNDLGLALRRATNRVFDEVDATLGAARQAKRGLVGRCVIAAVSTLSASRIIAATTRLCHERYPGVSLVFEEYPTPRQPDAIREGLVDAGICQAFLSLPDDPHVAHQHLQVDIVDRALVAVDHPLAQQTSLTAPELAPYPFLFMDRAFGPLLFDRVLAKLAVLGLRPELEGGYDSLHLIWMLASQGKGWALSFGVQPGVTPAGLVSIPVEGLSLTFGLDLLWRRNEVNPVVAKVLDAIRQVRGASATPHRPRTSNPARSPRAKV